MRHEIAFLMLALVGLSGCSVVMAATDAPEVHYQALGQGTPRRMVIDRLGPPMISYDVDAGGRLDRYEFKAGMGDRALRAVGFALADLLTLGLTELISTPFEVIKRADTLEADALFDDKDLLVTMEIRKESGEPVAVIGDSRLLLSAQQSSLRVSAPPPQGVVSDAGEQSTSESNEPEHPAEIPDVGEGTVPSS